METDQIRVEQTLEDLVPVVEGVEDGRGWECLMEVEPDVGLENLIVADVQGQDEELIAVNPNGIRLEFVPQLVDFMSDFVIDVLEVIPSLGLH